MRCEKGAGAGAKKKKNARRTLQAPRETPLFLFNPFRAPEPLPILNPSNFVSKNGFPFVKGSRLLLLCRNGPDSSSHRRFPKPKYLRAAVSPR